MKRTAIFWSIFLLPWLLCSAALLNFNVINTEYYDVTGSCEVLSNEDNDYNVLAKAYITIKVENGKLYFKLTSNKSEYKFQLEFPLSDIKIQREKSDGNGVQIYSFQYKSDCINYVYNDEFSLFILKVDNKKIQLEPAVRYASKSTGEIDEQFGTGVLSPRNLGKWFEHLYIRINSLKYTPQPNGSYESRLQAY